MFRNSEGEKVKYPFVKVRMSLVKENNVDECVVLDNPKDIFEYTREYFQGLDREHLLVIYLDAQDVVTGVEVNSVGDLSSTSATGREIFKGAILANAESIILVHNHPSSTTKPSFMDKRHADNFKQVGNMLGICVDVVLVVTEDNYEEVV